MKKVIAGLIASVMALSLVACGGAGASSGTSTGNASEASSVASTSATGARSVEDIKASGELVMLTNAEFFPFEYMDGDKITGVDVELAEKIAEELGVELKITNMDFDGLTVALSSGRGDLIAAGMSIDPDREKQVDFSIPYVDTVLRIVVPEDNDSITSAEDLAGKSVSVQEGTTSWLYVTSEDSGISDVQAFKASSEAATAVKTGRAEAMVMDELTAQKMISAVGGLKMLEDVEVSVEQYAMAVQKGSDLKDVVDKVLQAAVDADEVNSLITKHIDLSSEG